MTRRRNSITCVAPLEHSEHPASTSSPQLQSPASASTPSSNTLAFTDNTSKDMASGVYMQLNYRPIASSSAELQGIDNRNLQSHMDSKERKVVTDSPTMFGIPLKYISLVILAVQNAALAITMFYSRASAPPGREYSPAVAVLLNEILKGSISFLIAWKNRHDQEAANVREAIPTTSTPSISKIGHPTPSYLHSLRRVISSILSPDCWELSIPAILYVVQNSLQFVAISNLPVATFQLTYQMKILTTAAFSVAMLGKTLSRKKWLALVVLALGVGVVQLQSITAASPPKSTTSRNEVVAHVMNPLKGFAAVIAACFTSGLAGVYFEMVLKGSKADLWVRNVQLSLFSLTPAILPIVFSSSPSPSSVSILASSESLTFSPFSLISRFVLHLPSLFKNFTLWAWATVFLQVFGGLVTALVIKYSDNILKGFATSLAIVLSFLASVVLFEFAITPSFVLGSAMVLGATWWYNQPDQESGEGGCETGAAHRA